MSIRKHVPLIVGICGLVFLFSGCIFHANWLAWVGLVLLGALVLVAIFCKPLKDVNFFERKV